MKGVPGRLVASTSSLFLAMNSAKQLASERKKNKREIDPCSHRMLPPSLPSRTIHFLPLRRLLSSRFASSSPPLAPPLISTSSPAVAAAPGPRLALQFLVRLLSSPPPLLLPPPRQGLASPSPPTGDLPALVLRLILLLLCTGRNMILHLIFS